MSAELRDKPYMHEFTNGGGTRYEGTQGNGSTHCPDCRRCRLDKIIESERDRALAVRTEAIVSIVARDFIGVSPLTKTIAEIRSLSLSTAAEQAALEAIKQQVRQAALREAAGAVISNKPVPDIDGNFVERSNQAAGAICAHLDLPYKWPDSQFGWLAAKIQSLLFELREKKRNAILALLDNPSPEPKALVMIPTFPQNFFAGERLLIGFQYWRKILPVVAKKCELSR